MSITEKTLTIAGPVGQLEAVLSLPGTVVPGRVALVCHPHSLQGGTMQNKVVTTVVRACVNAGMPTLRFNFRSVGASEGQFDNGVGEVEDCIAASTALKALYPDAALFLAGFSFGSAVAYAASTTVRPAGLLLMAPPVERFPFPPFPATLFPWWVFQPEADEVVTPEAVYQWVASMPAEVAPTLRRFIACSHFFHGQLIALRAAVESVLTEIPWDR